MSRARGGVVLIAGGGTGGHVYPALALADALGRRGVARDEVRFVGARRGLEARAVPHAGYAIDLLPVRGLQRGFALRDLLANARAAWDLVVSVLRAVRIVRRWRPRVLVGVGGYASVPALVAARLTGVPTVVHEQNCRDRAGNCRGTSYYARDGSWSYLDMILWSPARERGAQATWVLRENSVRIANGAAEQVGDDGTPARFTVPGGRGVSDHWPLHFSIEPK